MATATETLLVEIDGRTTKLQQAITDAQSKIKQLAGTANTTTTTVGEGATMIGSKYALATRNIAGAAAQIAATGKVSTESVKGIVTQASMMAGAFGAGGIVLGALGIATVAIVNMYKRASEEHKQWLSSLQTAQDAGDVNRLKAEARSLYVGNASAGRNPANNEFRGSVRDFEAQMAALEQARKSITSPIEELPILTAMRKLEAQFKTTLERYKEVQQMMKDLGTPATFGALGTVGVSAKGPNPEQAAKEAQEKMDAATKKFAEMDLKAELASLKVWVDEWVRLEKALKGIAEGDLSVLETDAIKAAITRDAGTSGGPPIVGSGALSPAEHERLRVAAAAEKLQKDIDTAVDILVGSFAANGGDIEGALRSLAATISSGISHLIAETSKAVGGYGGAAFAVAATGVTAVIGMNKDKIAERVAEATSAALAYHDALRDLAIAKANGNEVTLRQTEREDELKAAKSEAERILIAERHAVEDNNRAHEEAIRQKEREAERVRLEQEEIADLERELAVVRAGGNRETLLQLDFQERLNNAKTDEARAILQQIYATEQAIAAEEALAKARADALKRQEQEEDLFDITNPADIIRRRVTLYENMFGDLFDGILDGIDLDTQEGLDELTKRLQELFASLTPERLAELGITPEMFEEIIAAILGLERAADAAADGINDAVDDIYAFADPFEEHRKNQAAKGKQAGWNPFGTSTDPEGPLNPREEVERRKAEAMALRGDASATHSISRATIEQFDRSLALDTTRNALLVSIRDTLARAMTFGTLNAPQIPGFGSIGAGATVTTNHYTFKIYAGDLSQPVNLERLARELSRLMAKEDQRQSRDDGRGGMAA